MMICVNFHAALQYYVSHEGCTTESLLIKKLVTLYVTGTPHISHRRKRKEDTNHEIISL
jgi:hypothetical protein